MDSNNELGDKAEEYKRTLIQDECRYCKGEGRCRDYGDSYECYECDGLGIKLTNFGDEVASIAWRSARKYMRNHNH